MITQHTGKRERRHVPIREMRVSTGEDGTRTITGYAAVFGQMSVDFGGWVESIAPNAFTRSLQESPDVLCLANHDTTLVLGRTSSNTLTLEVDSTGLKFSCALPETTYARDLSVSIDRGDIRGCSFGFYTNSAGWSQLEDGRELRTLLDVTLVEVTITSDPAYIDTSVALRSAPKEVRSRLEREKRDDGDEEMDSANDGCDCLCPECQDGNCADCSNQDCDDDDCDCAETRYRSDVERQLGIADVIASS